MALRKHLTWAVVALLLAEPGPASARPKASRPSEAPCPGVEALKKRAPAFRPGEELAYELSFAGAYIGRFETKVGLPRLSNGSQIWPLFGRARTNAFVGSIKSFEGRYQSLVEPAIFFPNESRVEATFDGDSRWEKIYFESDRRSLHAEFFLNGRDQERGYQSDRALTDILALLYQARSVELSKGLRACQPVYGARRLWNMTATIVGETEVETPAGNKPAWKVATVFERAPHPELNHLPAQRIELDVYLGKEAGQTPLHFVARWQGLEAEGRLVRWSLEGTSDGPQGLDP